MTITKTAQGIGLLPCAGKNYPSIAALQNAGAGNRGFYLVVATGVVATVRYVPLIKAGITFLGCPLGRFLPAAQLLSHPAKVCNATCPCKLCLVCNVWAIVAGLGATPPLATTIACQLAKTNCLLLSLRATGVPTATLALLVVAVPVAGTLTLPLLALLALPLVLVLLLVLLVLLVFLLLAIVKPLFGFWPFWPFLWFGSNNHCYNHTSIIPLLLLLASGKPIFVT